MATTRSLDGSVLPVHAGGRPPTLKPEHIAFLHDVVTERALASRRRRQICLQIPEVFALARVFCRQIFRRS